MSESADEPVGMKRCEQINVDANCAALALLLLEHISQHLCSEKVISAQEIAAFAGRLRNDGFPGGTADAIILATALRAKGRVMTGDLHFKGLYDTLFVGS